MRQYFMFMKWGKDKNKMWRQRKGVGHHKKVEVVNENILLTYEMKTFHCIFECKTDERRILSSTSPHSFYVKLPWMKPETCSPFSNKQKRENYKIISFHLPCFHSDLYLSQTHKAIFKWTTARTHLFAEKFF